MKTKTINQIINKKFKEWIATIKDENVRKLVEKNSILTGGAIASMLLQQPVNDFDFYFKNKETTKAVADYYLAKFLKNPPPSFANGKPVTMFVQDEDDRIKIVVKSAGIAGWGCGFNQLSKS